MEISDELRDEFEKEFSYEVGGFAMTFDARVDAVKAMRNQWGGYESKEYPKVAIAWEYFYLGAVKGGYRGTTD